MLSSRRVPRAAGWCLLPLALWPLLASCRTTDQAALKEEPTGDNALHWWGLETLRYDEIPASGRLTKQPWPGDYWATYRGGIAFRWQHADAESGDYKRYLFRIPDQTQIGQLGAEQIARLSPAEKYDLWVGRTDLTAKTSATGTQRAFTEAAAKLNRDRYGRDEIPSWTGICNGWSLAAIFEDYPANPVTVTSPTGQSIVFYPADIQALISQIYFDYQPAITVARLGAMCSEAQPARTEQGRVITPSCRDVNPMSFHVALGKRLGQDQSFVFDVEPGNEVWNQPAYAYAVAYGPVRPKPADYPHAAPGTINVVDVAVTLAYVVEVGPSVSGLSAADMANYVRNVVYRYTLELDAGGKMLGGEWTPGSKIPDFLWLPKQMPSDQLLQQLNPGYPLSYDKVRQLVTASARR